MQAVDAAQADQRSRLAIALADAMEAVARLGEPGERLAAAAAREQLVAPLVQHAAGDGSCRRRRRRRAPRRGRRCDPRVVRHQVDDDFGGVDDALPIVQVLEGRRRAMRASASASAACPGVRRIVGHVQQACAPRAAIAGRGEQRRGPACSSSSARGELLAVHVGGGELAPRLRLRCAAALRAWARVATVSSSATRGRGRRPGTPSSTSAQQRGQCRRRADGAWADAGARGGEERQGEAGGGREQHRADNGAGRGDRYRRRAGGADAPPALAYSPASVAALTSGASGGAAAVALLVAGRGTRCGSSRRRRRGRRSGRSSRASTGSSGAASARTGRSAPRRARPRSRHAGRSRRPRAATTSRAAAIAPFGVDAVAALPVAVGAVFVGAAAADLDAEPEAAGSARSGVISPRSRSRRSVAVGSSSRRPSCSSQPAVRVALHAEPARSPRPARSPATAAKASAETVTPISSRFRIVVLPAPGRGRRSRVPVSFIGPRRTRVRDIKRRARHVRGRFRRDSARNCTATTGGGRWRGRGPASTPSTPANATRRGPRRGGGPDRHARGPWPTAPAGATSPLGTSNLRPRPDFILSSQNGRQNCTALGCSSVQTSRQRFLGGGPE